MADSSVSIRRETHDPPPDHVPASEGAVVQSTGPSGLPLFIDGSPRESGTQRVAECRSVSPRRIFAAVSWPHDYGVAVLARGPLEAIEQPELSEAPVGSLLITDADATRGVVVAERIEEGWLIRPGANVTEDGGRRG